MSNHRNPAVSPDDEEVVFPPGRPEYLPKMYINHNHPLHKSTGKAYYYVQDGSLEGMKKVKDIEHERMEVPSGSEEDAIEKGFLKLYPGDAVYVRLTSASPSGQDDVPVCWLNGRDLYSNELKAHALEVRDRVLGPRHLRSRQMPTGTGNARTGGTRFEREFPPKENVRGGRCYPYGTSYEAIPKLYAPCAQGRNDRCPLEVQSYRSDLLKVTLEMATQNLSAGPEEVAASLQLNHELLNTPSVGVSTNAFFGANQLNLAPAESSDSTNTLAGALGTAGSAHIDPMDSPSHFTNMTCASDLPENFDPGRFFILYPGVFYQQGDFVSFCFSGLRRHGGTPPIAPPGTSEDVLRWAIRVTLVSYPPKGAVSSTQRRVLCANGLGSSFNVTPEMIVPEHLSPNNFTVQHATFAQEGHNIMNRSSLMSFVCRSLLQIVMFVLRQLPNEINARVDSDAFLRSFSYSNNNGERENVGVWECAPGWRRNASRDQEDMTTSDSSTPMDVDEPDVLVSQTEYIAGKQAKWQAFSKKYAGHIPYAVAGKKVQPLEPSIPNSRINGNNLSRNSRVGSPKVSSSSESNNIQAPASNHLDLSSQDVSSSFESNNIQAPASNRLDSPTLDEWFNNQISENMTDTHTLEVIQNHERFADWLDNNKDVEKDPSQERTNMESNTVTDSTDRDNTPGSLSYGGEIMDLNFESLFHFLDNDINMRPSTNPADSMCVDSEEEHVELPVLDINGSTLQMSEDKLPGYLNDISDRAVYRDLTAVQTAAIELSYAPNPFIKTDPHAFLSHLNTATKEQPLNPSTVAIINQTRSGLNNLLAEELGCTLWIKQLRSCVMMGNYASWMWIENTIPSYVSAIISEEFTGHCVWLEKLVKDVEYGLSNRMSSVSFFPRPYGLDIQGEAVAQLNFLQYSYDPLQPDINKISTMKAVHDIVGDWMSFPIDSKSYWRAVFVETLYTTVGLDAMVLDCVWESYQKASKTSVTNVKAKISAFICGDGSKFALFNQTSQLRQNMHKLATIVQTFGHNGNANIAENNNIFTQKQCTSQIVDDRIASFECFIKQCFNHQFRHQSTGNPALDDLLTNKSDHFLPFREKAATRTHINEIGGPFDPRFVRTLPGLFSALVSRATTFDTRFSREGRTLFNNPDDFFHATEELGCENESEYCNPGAYGQPNPQKKAKLVYKYWTTLEAQHDDTLWPGFYMDQPIPFMKCYDYFYPPKGPPTFPHLGQLGAYLLTVDYVYAGIVEAPTASVIAEMIRKLNKGAISALELLGLTPTRPRGSGGHKLKSQDPELPNVFKKAHDIVASCIPQEFHGEAGLDLIVTEHALCKYARLTKGAQSVIHI